MVEYILLKRQVLKYKAEQCFILSLMVIVRVMLLHINRYVVCFLPFPPPQETRVGGVVRQRF